MLGSPNQLPPLPYLLRLDCVALRVVQGCVLQRPTTSMPTYPVTHAYCLLGLSVLLTYSGLP